MAIADLNLHALVSFIGAAVVITLSPGPDIVFVFTQALTRGTRAGIVSAAGLCSGLIVHTTLAALGVSAIFRSWPVAFNTLKFCGAAYLLLLAWQSLRESFSIAPAAASASKDDDSGDETQQKQSTQLAAHAPSNKKLYRTTVLMNLLNPKVAIFFLAFLPQFADSQGGHMIWQMLTLGVIFMVQAFAVFSLTAILAGAASRYLTSSPAAKRIMSATRGVVFISLAAWLMLASL